MTTDPLESLKTAIRHAIDADRQNSAKWNPLYDWFSRNLGIEKGEVAAKLLTENKQLSNRIKKELTQKEPRYAVLTMLDADFDESDVLRHLRDAVLPRTRSVLITLAGSPRRLIVFEEDDTTRAIEEIVGSGVEREDWEPPGSPASGSIASLHPFLQRVLELQSEYSPDTTDAMRERGLAVRRQIPAAVMLLGASGIPDDWGVEGSDGLTKKAKVPWVRLHSRHQSPSATSGWYLVYLFSEDGERLYLSLNRGSAMPQEGGLPTEAAEDLARDVEEARELLNDPDSEAADLPSITLGGGAHGERFELGHVMGIEYRRDSLPDDDQLISDLLSLIPFLETLYEQTQSDPEVDVDIATVTQDFADFLEARGIMFDELTQLDLLAACLGSQLLLFAGPSGTGKSTAAYALAEFFAPSRRGTIFGERTWENSEDFVGYYSAFKGQFVGNRRLDALLALADPEGADDGDGTDSPPFVVVEEANLSPIEGYLNPVVHQLSGIGKQEIVWWLYSTDDGGTVSVALKPFPRVFGTINVDASAPGPAKKVSARACVVLLEAPENTDIERLAQSIGLREPTSTAGGAWIGDPRLPLLEYLKPDEDGSLLEGLTAPLRALVDRISDAIGHNVLSQRDAKRCLCFMGAFVQLAEYRADWDLGDRRDHAAELALLHFVLPGLSGQHFGRAVASLLESEMLHPQGLLIRRLSRLQEMSEGHGFGVVTDFWTALS